METIDTDFAETSCYQQCNDSVSCTHTQHVEFETRLCRNRFFITYLQQQLQFACVESVRTSLGFFGFTLIVCCFILCKRFLVKRVQWHHTSTGIDIWLKFSC